GARSVGLDTAPLPDRPTASRSSVLVRWAAALGRLSRRRPVLGGAILLLTVSQIAIIALAGQSHRVIQKDRSFLVKEIDITAGDEVQFSNEDQFLHQIYVASGDLDFDSAEQPPGQVISITFPKPGTYQVRCHIHPKMLLVVNAKEP
ncbi:MAG: cupredoxin domain-containing protein, partial [Alphaproteobacteria bacterium]